MNYKKYELRELIEIKNGKDLKNKNNGTIPVYGTGGIIGNIDQYLYDGESILLPRKGSLDNIEYVNGKFWTIDTMYWTKINKNIVYGKFLFLYLSLLNTSKRNTGSTLPSMTFETYYSLKIFLPEYKEQKKIADFIFKIIEKINKNNQINNNLEELMKIIYQRWFLEYKFPKHNQIVDKELPKGWKLDKIGTLFESQSGYAFKSRDWTKSGIPVLTIKCIKEDGSINYKESSFIEKTEEKLNKYYAQKRKYDFGDEW